VLISLKLPRHLLDLWQISKYILQEISLKFLATLTILTNCVTHQVDQSYRQRRIVLHLTDQKPFFFYILVIIGGILFKNLALTLRRDDQLSGLLAPEGRKVGELPVDRPLDTPPGVQSLVFTIFTLDGDAVGQRFARFLDTLY
jgi:hypothetical protein